MIELPLSLPDITEREIAAVTDVMRSGRLSIGPRQDLFEQMVATCAGRNHGIAVSSGTAGLHLVLLALGIGPGDEIITTPFSFIASANSILMVGAKPVFVDIDPQSLNMDPSKVEAAITPATRGILAVEVFGNPKHMDTLERIARQNEIPLIEDCCEALGGVLGDRPCGNFGRAGVFAFYPNKQITTGEGGVIVTDDDRLADLCRSMRNQGRAVLKKENDIFNAPDAGHWLSHERLGFNYRLSEIAAAIGIVQMERLDGILERRREVAAMYMQKMMDWEDVVLPTVDESCMMTMSWFVFVIRMSHQFTRLERNRIIKGLRRHEVGTSNYFPCIHLQPFYKEKFGYDEGDFPVAEAISDRTIALPFFNQLDETQVDLACHTLQIMIQRENLLKRDT